MMLSSSRGVYRSDGGGMAWQLTASNAFYALDDLTYDPSNPNRIAGIGTLATDPANAATVFAGVDQDAGPATLAVLLTGASATAAASASGACTVSGQNVACAFASLANGASASVTVTATSPNVGSGRFDWLAAMLSGLLLARRRSMRA